MQAQRHDYDIPGTIVFDGHRAADGYALNKMCFSFNSAENRAEFLRDPDAYCRKFKLADAQRKAIKEHDVLALLESGGHIYYLAKWAGMLGMSVQDIGARQTGMTVEEFKAMLARGGAH
jgi:protocatechuate 4,5-dioxygenase alpha chain